jgi:hypothetical protein
MEWRLLEPLQLDATSGGGKTLTVPDPARLVRFIIKGSPTGGATMGGGITFEYCLMATVPTVSSIVWRALKTLPVPTDIFSVTQYYSGEVSGMFRARISTPVTGGTITVWPLVGVLIGNVDAALEPVVR